MPTEREVCGYDEGRLADEPAIHQARIHPAVALRGLHDSAVLELDPDTHW